ncbi:hypothetical protein ACN28S_24510 [Cystobacter fuscus]
MPALVLGLLLTTTDVPPSGSATVPLPELLTLYGKKEHEAAPPEPPREPWW